LTLVRFAVRGEHTLGHRADRRLIPLAILTRLVVSGHPRIHTVTIVFTLVVIDYLLMVSSGCIPCPTAAELHHVVTNLRRHLPLTAGVRSAGTPRKAITTNTLHTTLAHAFLQSGNRLPQLLHLAFLGLQQRVRGAPI